MFHRFGVGLCSVRFFGGVLSTGLTATPALLGEIGSKMSTASTEYFFRKFKEINLQSNHKLMNMRLEFIISQKTDVRHEIKVEFRMNSTL